uniref:hypothetical protein n=1 Tax=Eubacterium cellulosolvens TaxID=29322 RepID=UPI0004853C18|nr:hypothetical protein [[Eubacterium] cellulosolvens]
MFVYYINVPLNIKGMREFEAYEDEMPNVKTFELTQEEYEYLRKTQGLFSEFDEKFGTIIDVCEEERISFDDLPEALCIAKEHLKKSKTGKCAIEKVIESLECAIESRSFWEIDIYLD